MERINKTLKGDAEIIARFLFGRLPHATPGFLEGRICCLFLINELTPFLKLSLVPHIKKIDEILSYNVPTDILHVGEEVFTYQGSECAWPTP